ncbi:GA-binding protein subunit beta-1 isoform X2 [Patella vulgata]|uniref:GA-binding protein subunit beta-1 isoform X2 n=1 Tax=Patella vulgata TaxID=6465 RepID=UPI00217FEF99|nr:GA-binding protein subunit beta-1 isoform X2 [Patella vulgata]
MSLVDLGKRLLDAAKKGDTDAVRALMSNGAPFTTDWLGTSPLHFATQCGHQHTVEVLLRAGISRDARTKVDRTPLHVAAQEGHVGIVELLLQNAADIDAKDMLKMTPLHWATEKGHVQIIEVLLKHGADINCANKFDRTPLDIAIANGRLDLAQMLRNGQLTLPSLPNADGEIVTIETTEATEIVSTSEQLEVDSVNGTCETDQSSTSVLATLAALAEASGPINSQNVSSAETMNWLESHGITMISTADGSIITSAVDSGQTITLTEAGKIALDIIQQQELVGETVEETEVTEGVDNSNIETLTVQDGDSQKVITIVANTQDSTENEETLAVVDTETLQNVTLITQPEDNSDEPVCKKIKIEDNVIEDLSTEQILQEEDDDGTEQLVLHLEETGGAETITTEDTTTETTTTEITVEDTEQKEGVEDNHDDLKRQLEEVQKQAKAFQEKLREKEEEAETYKKQLSEKKKSE